MSVATGTDRLAAPSVLRQLGALTVYTLKESLHRWTLVAFLAAVSLFLLLLATAVSLDIVEGTLASARLFGQQIDLRSQGVDLQIREVVDFFQTTIVYMLYIVGIAMALFSSSNLIPRLCVEGWVDLLIAQPIARETLLLGRALGALSVVAVNIGYLIVGTWLILRWKTGLGTAGYLVSGLIILFAFAVCYSAMVLVGVMTRNSPVSSMAGLGVWVAGHILYAFHTFPEWRVALRAGWRRQTAVVITESLYWIMPKNQGLGAMAVTSAQGGVFDWTPLLYSLPFAVTMLALACWWFQRRDF